jgi:hypothetical protein
VCTLPEKLDKYILKLYNINREKEGNFGVSIQLLNKAKKPIYLPKEWRGGWVIFYSDLLQSFGRQIWKFFKEEKNERYENFYGLCFDIWNLSGCSLPLVDHPKPFDHRGEIGGRAGSEV